MSLAYLREDSVAFPEVGEALTEPNGLLAVGGDLSPERLVNAYASGIFPWFDSGQPILWWSPDPRAVLFTGDIHISRSLRRSQRRHGFNVTIDTAFARVVDGCSEPRADSSGTWITPEMREAYIDLHYLGIAHSIEVWKESRLAGGLYGVSLGRLFFGESMFHRETDASKVAIVTLCQLLRSAGCPILDCQVPNDHLASLGAVEIPRDAFLDILKTNLPEPLNWTALAQDATMALSQWSR